MGSDIQAALKQLQDICTSIEHWRKDVLPFAQYRAPIVDWHHPDDYAQKGVAGLRKFQSTVEAERDHVASLASSAIRSKEFSTNSPHLIAVWDEFLRCSWPISGISQTLDVGTKASAKIDIISRGGSEWVKVNTIKESRLLSEFREQDSYVNSDYDSDTSSPGAGPSRTPTPILSNSLITLSESLLRAAKTYPRPIGRAPPTVRLVLTRLIRPSEGFKDDRIDQTITHLRSLGVIVQLGPSSGPIATPTPLSHLHPTKNIVLDLSVLVALCCDSTHFPLPTNKDGFESRFRSRRVDPVTGEIGLSDHSNTSKDLRDQLQWEAQHPLIQEMKDRLGLISDDKDGRDLRFWITDEVKGRLPGLVEIIGGPEERRRGKILLDPSSEEDFWAGSRWSGDEGVLRDIRVGILPEDPEDHALGSEGEGSDGINSQDGYRSNGTTYDNDDLSTSLSTLHLETPISPFQSNLASTCRSLLYLMDHQLPYASTSTPNSRTPRRSRNPNRNEAVFPTSRAPSGHTLRTLIAGAQRGWTVLSNNRGAVGKVCREMGVTEGLSWIESQGDMGESVDEEAGVDKVAAVWVVNPSSLSEWRRLEVLRENEHISKTRQEG